MSPGMPVMLDEHCRYSRYIKRSSIMREDSTVLLAGILHNVNNYLQTIVGNAILGMNSSRIYNSKNHFKAILSTADRCSETIKQMMTMIKSGKKESCAVDIRTVISDIIEMFEPISESITGISYSSEDVPN